MKKFSDFITESPEDMEPASPDEKSMALRQAEFIMYVGREIGEHLQKNKEFPEWMQNKLSALHQKAKDMHATLGDHGEDDMKEELEFKVKVDGLPDMYVKASGKGEVKANLRKIVKKPEMIQSINRITRTDIRKVFRDKMTGKESTEE